MNMEKGYQPSVKANLEVVSTQLMAPFPDSWRLRLRSE